MQRGRIYLTVVAVVIATTTSAVAIRRAGFGAGDPRRLHAETNTYVFGDTSTSSYSIPSTMTESLGWGWWAGDDHARLTLFEMAMSSEEGVSQGQFTEFAWDLTHEELGFVTPPLFWADAVRHTDIGYCSQAQTWTQPEPVEGMGFVSSPVGCGLLDQIAWGFVEEVMDGFINSSIPPIPAVTTGVLTNGPFVRTRFNYTHSAITDDSFCVDTKWNVVLASTAGLPGVCHFKSLKMEFCGRFVMIENGSGTRDASFMLRDTSVGLGPSAVDPCWPWLRDGFEDALNDAIDHDLDLPPNVRPSRV
jgi:hypothetical protein